MEIPFILHQAELEVSWSHIFYQLYKSLKASHPESVLSAILFPDALLLMFYAALFFISTVT